MNAAEYYQQLTMKDADVIARMKSEATDVTLHAHDETVEVMMFSDGSLYADTEHAGIFVAASPDEYADAYELARENHEITTAAFQNYL